MSKLIKKAFALVVATVSLGLFADSSNDDTIRITDGNVGDNWTNPKGSSIVTLPAGADATKEWKTVEFPNVGKDGATNYAMKVTVAAPSGKKEDGDLAAGVNVSLTFKDITDPEAKTNFTWSAGDFDRKPISGVADSRYEKDFSFPLKAAWLNACVTTNGLKKDFLSATLKIDWNGGTKYGRVWDVHFYVDGIVLKNISKDVAGVTCANKGGFPEEYAVIYDTSKMPQLKPWEGGGYDPVQEATSVKFTILDTRDLTNLTDTANCKLLGWKLDPASKIDPAETIHRAEYKDEIINDNNFSGIVVTASWEKFSWFVTTNAVVGTETNEVKVGFTDLTGALALVNSLTNDVSGITLSLNENFYAPWQIAESENKYFWELNGFDDVLRIEKVSNVAVDLKGGEVASDYYGVEFRGVSGIVRNGKVLKRKLGGYPLNFLAGTTVTLTNIVAVHREGVALGSENRAKVTLASDVELLGKTSGIEVLAGSNVVVPETSKNVYVTGQTGAALSLQTNTVFILKSGYFKGSSNGKPFEFIDNEQRVITVDFDCVTTNWVGALFECNTLASWANCAKGVIPVDQKINGKDFTWDLEDTDYRYMTNYRYGFMAVPDNATAAFEDREPVAGNPTFEIENCTITNKDTYTKGEYEFAVKVTAPTNDGFKATIQKGFNISAEPGVKADISGEGRATLDVLEADHQIYSLAEDGSFTWYVTTSRDQLHEAAVAGTVVTNTIAINWDGQNGVTNLITVTIDPLTVVLWDKSVGDKVWPKDYTVTVTNALDEAGWTTNAYGTVEVPWGPTYNVLNYNELDAITNTTYEAGFFKVYNLADRYGFVDPETGDVCNYKFTGWGFGGSIITNEPGVTTYGYLPFGLATNVELEAKWERASWTLLAQNGATNGIYATLKSAYDAAASNETIRLDATVYEMKNQFDANLTSGAPVTVDLNGNTMLAKKASDFGYLIWIADAQVTIKNGTIVNETVPGEYQASSAICAYRSTIDLQNVSMFADQPLDVSDNCVIKSSDSTLALPAGAVSNKYNPGVQIHKSKAAFENVTFGENTDWTKGLRIKVLMCDSVAFNNCSLFGAKLDNDGYSALELDQCGDVVVNGGHIESINADAISAQSSSVEVAGNATILTFGTSSAIGFYGTSKENVLTIGDAQIKSEGNGIYFAGGSLDIVPNSDLFVQTRGNALAIENNVKGYVIEPSDVSILGGVYEVVDFTNSCNGVDLAERYLEGAERSPLADFRRALISTSNTSDPELKGFLTIGAGCKPAVFSTIIDDNYVAEGYQTADNGVLHPNSWFFIQANDYAITYDAGKGVITGETKTSYAITNSVVLPEAQRASYNFLGWTNQYGEAFAPSTSMVWNENLDKTGDVTFYARWGAESYHLHVQNRSAGTPRLVSPVSTNIVMTDLAKIKIEAPVAKGYKFNYWKATNGTQYFPGTEYGLDDFKWNGLGGTNATITAVWTGESVVSIITNGVTAAEYSNFKDALADLGKFEGGYLSVTSETGRFAIDETLFITNDNVEVQLNGCTLHPSENFVGDALVVISNAANSFVDGGILDGTVPGAAIRIYADDKPAKALTKDYTLLFTVPVDDAFIADGYTCDVIEGTKGLYGVVAKVYNLTFSLGEAGGRTFADFPAEANNEAATYTAESGLILIKDATRACYDFTGWTNAAGQKVSAAFDPTGVTADTVLTATWKAREYAITYELNEGEFAGASKNRYNCEEGAFTLATPVRQGYNFVGWCLEGAKAANPCTVDPQAMTAAEFKDLNAVAAWEADCYVITFDTVGGEAISDLRYNKVLVDQGVVEIPVPEKAGAKFINWVDKNGSVIPTGKITGCYYPEKLELTAVWERSLWTGDNTVIAGNPADGRGKVFDGAAQVTYSGYLVDSAKQICAKVAVTASKATTKKVDGESKKVVSITMTVSATLGSAKSYTFKNAAAVIDGNVLETSLTSGSKTTLMTAAIKISNNGLAGSIAGYALDGCTIIASADRFSTNVSKIPAATLAYLQGNWTLAVQNTNFCHGAATLKLAIGAKGKVTITGNLPEGTAVSTTAQLIYGDGVCVCPVVINAFSGKKGGCSFNVWFATTGTGDNLADDVEVTDFSDFYGADGEVLCTGSEVFAKVQRVADCVLAADYSFTIPLAAGIKGAVEELGYELLTTQDVVDVAWNGSKFVVPTASKITVKSGTGDVTWTKQAGNDLGLALTYTAKTGALTGSFKIYAKETKEGTRATTYALKTFTVKVYGVVMTDGLVVEGAAVEKNLGSFECHLALPGVTQGK